MAAGKKKKFDLDRGTTVVCQLSEDAKRLVIELQVEKDGLTKTSVNGLIDALKKFRDKMSR